MSALEAAADERIAALRRMRDGAIAQRNAALAERDRARALAANLAGIAQERERLLWAAIEADDPMAQARVGREIAQHLRETAFIPGLLEAGL